MKRTKFNLSNYRLASMEMGKLYPVELQELLPGDTISSSSSAFIRFSPMLAPVLHPITVRIHKFVCPMRIIFPGWEDFITGGPDGNDQSVIPMGTVNNETDHSLLDYLGYPVDGTENSRFSWLPVYAFNKIWNEFYRDQDLQEEREETDLTIPHVAWAKDYYTAARPWPQKGNDVVIPIGTRAPVKGLGVGTAMPWEQSPSPDVVESDGEVRTYDFGWQDPRQDPQGNDAWVMARGEGVTSIPDIYADLSQATGISVTDLRNYFAQQRWQEARAQFGSRYTEYLAFLGVRSSDQRLQRPEYFGGGKSTASISEVLQTGTDENTPVGTLRGHGIAATRSRQARKFCEEHAYMITLMSIVPKNMYVNGCDRHWLKETRNEFWQREFEHVGQQQVWNGEVRVQPNGDPTVNKGTFGWSERYSEYRRTPSRVVGEFRDLLNYWHMGRTFETQPALNDEFIECNPTKRIFAEQTQDPLWCAVQNNSVARRLVSNTTIGRVK